MELYLADAIESITNKLQIWQQWWKFCKRSFFWRDREHKIVIVWKIAQSKPDKDIAIRGWEPSEQNWPCCLGGWDVLSPPVNHSSTSQMWESVSSRMKRSEGRMVLSSQCIMLPFDAAWLDNELSFTCPGRSRYTPSASVVGGCCVIGGNLTSVQELVRPN